MRQTSGSFVCPGCAKLIDIDEAACPNCGRWQPGLFGFAPLLARYMGGLEVTALITSVCIGLYIISLALDPRSILGGEGGIMGILAPSYRARLQLGMTGDVPLTDGSVIPWYRNWYTIFSANFLHGNLLHIFFNLMWIRQLGPIIEEAFGSVRMFVIFMLAGAGGYVVSHVGYGATSGMAVPTVGASASIFGLIAAAIVFGRRRGGTLGNALYQQYLMYAVVLFVFGAMFSFTNNWAHGGGFAAGYLVSLYLVRNAETQEGPGLQLLSLALALITIIAVALSAIWVTKMVLRAG